MKIGDKMVYIDTNIFIYLFEGHVGYAEKVADYLEFNRQNNIKLVTSALTVTELLAGNSDITIDMLKMFQDLEIVVLSEDIAVSAGKIQNESNIHIGDAIHLATALSQNCTEIYTNDIRFGKKAGKLIKIKHPV